MNFDPNLPIYLQIVNEIKTRIASGRLPPGERLASVRDFALEFSVNPNTMQKALAELERESLVYSERTSGRYITKDHNVINLTRQEMAKKLVQNFTGQMLAIGYTKSEILGVLTVIEENELKEERNADE